MCPRCLGFVIHQYGETRCLLCGWYDNAPLSIELRERYTRKQKCRECGEPREAGYDHCPRCRAWRKRKSEEYYGAV